MRPDQEGYFEDEGVHVAVRDGIQGGRTSPRARWCHHRFGRALLTRLNRTLNGRCWSVNTHRPLFWFVGRGQVKSMDDLRGRRLAVHASHTAPGRFARIVLREHGLDP